MSWLMKKRIHQIELFIKYPKEVQQEVLKKLVNTAIDTDYGKKFHFDAIASYEDFRKQIPIRTYEEIESDILAVKDGQQNVFWPSEIKWFAKSSGTTSAKSKFIPVSKESLIDCHYKGGKDMLSIHCNNFPQTKIFKGKGLMLGGSRQINQINAESYYGDLSAILIANLPFWVSIRRTPDIHTMLMEEWEEKLDRIAHQTIHQNITNISGVPSWTLVLFKKVLEITGKQNIHEVWPNLELFIHGAVCFEPYKQQFQELLPDPKMRYLETYNASEGFFGIQYKNDFDDLLLMLDYGIFYEFIDMNDFNAGNMNAIPIWEVQEGVNYAMIITTNGGLWRYLIGDTIKFTSIEPYTIKITGRTKHFMNAFGEEVIVQNADQALMKACEATNASISEYTAAPKYMDNQSTGSHEWIIEFAISPDNEQLFKETLDEELKKLNSDYEAKRYKDMVLLFPSIHFAPKGTFYQWMKNRGKLGGQNKIPKLSNDRKYLDEILQLIS